MNGEKQVMKLAAERLPEDVRAFIESATLHLQSSASKTQDQHAAMFRVAYALYVKYDVEGRSIRPPAVAPEPKPSQAVLDACKRLGVEAWKLDRFLKGDRILGNGYVSERDGDTYGQACSPITWTADKDQYPAHTARYWHVRPIATPSLPCPPRPTPEQVAAARMPDGRRVKPPAVCEEPHGRAWFADAGGMVYADTSIRPHNHPVFGQRRWIAEPADAVVEPWTLGLEHAGKVVVRKAGGGWGIITGVRDGQFTVAGWGKITPAELLRDWTHNGKPCGVAK